MQNKYIIVAIVAVSCIIMGLTDAVIRPGYILKSIIKIPLFLLLPLIYSFFDKNANLKKLITPSAKGMIKALTIGFSVFVIILSVYFCTKDVFDFSGVTTALTGDVGVTKNNFLWVALYISFINSFLEEFFFRGFSFLTLKHESSRKNAYLFSSLSFALYHIAMMIGWFDAVVIAIAITGLVIGGIILNYFNEKDENIYSSWLIHMFANFSINTIGFMLFGII